MNQLDTMIERDVAPAARTTDMKLEVVAIPVADVDRAKRFYGDLGWRLDADFVVGDEFRGIQFTPPGSPCSIQFGTGGTVGRAGLGTRTLSCRFGHPVSACRAHQSRRRRERSVPPCGSGSATSQRSGSGAAQLLLLRHVQRSGRQRMAVAGGHHPVSRPDRLNATSFASASDLASAMRRASVAHGEHEMRTGGQRDENWPDWYAEYMVAEQAGKELPS